MKPRTSIVPEEVGVTAWYALQHPNGLSHFFLFLYVSLFFSHYAACTPHPPHLRAVHGYASLLSFHSATAVRLPHALLPFHSMAVLDACFYLMLLGSGIF